MAIQHVGTIAAMRWIAQAWNAWLGRTYPTDPTLWHRWYLVVPVRCIDGQLGWGLGKVWRRWHNGRWEYQEDPQTPEEWADSL